ncbi:PTS sugar transporter subunit IIA [Alteraurantiacibacter aquimixticola]|uniref:PTS sugar transporter subunit IIA n=1 Tax=Alteraurantiacibacter aquimixticola TaxID=2489173 RepID=A0A4T3EX38_9SPHN|nr:PTS sugar transporter subunit IIA [Alteraurantiacibacter aquimixticola]TIX49136.1 PTS sugar transporter subunit IIA [Alteraurantiacibacter aquimixticola]
MDSLFALQPDSVAIVDVRSKQDILAQLSSLFAQACDIEAETVLEYLDEREKLGSTGFGRGVAIPHARIPGIQRPVAALLKLEHAADFDAADGLPVDLVFGLLSPENSGAAHLHALASISRLMRDENMRDALADAPDVEAIYALLTNVSDRSVA